MNPGALQTVFVNSVVTPSIAIQEAFKVVVPLKTAMAPVWYSFWVIVNAKNTKKISTELQTQLEGRNCRN